MMEPALIHVGRGTVGHNDCKNKAFLAFDLRKLLYSIMPYAVHAQEVYEEVELQLHSLLTSVNHRMSGHAHAQLPTWRTV